jgi:hypothetical protein
VTADARTFKLGLAAFILATLGGITFIEGGLVALPVAGGVGLAAVVSWIVADRKRSVRALFGLAMGALSFAAGLAVLLWWVVSP